MRSCELKVVHKFLPGSVFRCGVTATEYGPQDRGVGETAVLVRREAYNDANRFGYTFGDGLVQYPPCGYA
jgi:hypothetical protein